MSEQQKHQTARPSACASCSSASTTRWSSTPRSRSSRRRTGSSGSSTATTWACSSAATARRSTPSSTSRSRSPRIGESPAPKVEVDAAGYRDRRRQALERQADQAAADAVRSARPVALDAMSATERKVVHEYLKDRSDVETYSEGTEPDRHLVVAPLEPDLDRRERLAAAAATVSRETLPGCAPPATRSRMPARSGRDELGCAASSASPCRRPSRGRWQPCSTCWRGPRRRRRSTIPARASASTSPTRWPAWRSERSARAATIADLGAGAGLPGLVLAAALPRARVVLVESVGRKCEFLREAAEAHGGCERRGRLRAARRSGATAPGAATSSAPGRSPRCPSCASTPRRCCAPDGVLVAWKGAVERRRRRRTPPRRRSTSASRSNPCAPLRRSPARSRRTLLVAAQDRAHARRIPSPAGNGQETTADCEKSAVNSHQLPRNRLQADPPRSPLASAPSWASCTPSRTRRAGSARPPRRSTSPPASPRRATRRCSSTSIPQGNATVGIGVDRQEGRGLYDVLSGDVEAPDAVRADADRAVVDPGLDARSRRRDDGAAAAAGL